MMQQTNMTDDEWTVDEAIENLKNAMNESGQSASDLFSSIDANDDGEINGPELYKGLLEHLGDRLSPGQVSMIIKALDSNDDNRIDLSELTAALEEEE
ncbi:MAG: EF-hand domain-containing protein [Candidatus Thermoplasmatota archaeon]|nr:EF-hand domain-containing protein [Candidatus Thermoplasmatota archaeon]